MKNSLVSVICLCYNHERFVRQSLDSVMNQSYSNLELIVVDDASTDGSSVLIEEWKSDKPEVTFLQNQRNEGSTKSFNRALAFVKGKYVIDLAADDVLLKERIEKQVEFFEKQTNKVGVIYSNARYIDEQEIALDVHFDRPRMFPYSGDIYCKLIDNYFIPTPTMMIRKTVLDELGGYDESLSYEDFDFWIRSARRWSYAYQPKILTNIRLVSSSQSQGYLMKGDPGMKSTLVVCGKIARLNRNEEEKKALINRLKYEIRQAFIAGKKDELISFFDAWIKLDHIPRIYLIIKYIGILGLKFLWIKRPVQYLIK